MTNNTCYEWRSEKRITQWLFCIGAFVASILCLFVIPHKSDGNFISPILGIVFGICAISSLISGRTIIDVTNHTVHRQQLLFGKFLLYRRSLSFGNFSKVFIEFREDLSDHQWDNYYVGLRLLSGRKLWVKYWSVRYGNPCPASKELAERLSNDLGLPIEEIVLAPTNEKKIVN